LYFVRRQTKINKIAIEVGQSGNIKESRLLIDKSEIARDLEEFIKGV
jgi:hypothetical protein